ncbi:MAG: HYR domain-containing protein, partial [Bacteroidota bacterium]
EAEFSYNGSSFCQNGTDPVVSHVTGVNGTYSFSIVSGGPSLALNPSTGVIDLSASSAGTYNVTNSVAANCGGTGSLIITGVVDGPLTGGIPKAVEFFAKNAIADLSQYGFSSANNGAQPPAVIEFTFPAVAVPACTKIWVATESAAFTNYFGFAPTYVNTVAPNINGDDAIVLYQSNVIIDVFGVVGQDGTGQAWDYEDGWAYRVTNTGPDGNTFVLANWTLSGTNALDNTTTNASAPNPWPIGTYTSGTPFTCTQTITIVAPPSADAGSNQMVCESTNVVLSATPAGGTWTSSNTGTFSNANSPTSTYTPGATGIHVLIWTVPSAGGVCTSASDQVFITVLEAADAEFSYPGTFFCGDEPNISPQHVTGVDGIYTCTVLHGGPTLSLNASSGIINLVTSNGGIYEVTNTVSGCGKMVISGVVDGPITGGLPKAVEFYVLEDIPDLSAYGFGSANNGGGTDGQEFTFPTLSATQGTYFWVATEANVFTNFFGFPPNFIANLAPSINGDDAIELFCNGVVIDVFGDISYVNTSGLQWLYTDSWVYRNINTGPDGSFFQLGNWTFGGVDALDPYLTNAAATAAGHGVPAKSFTSTKPGICGDAEFSQIITIDETAPICPNDVQITLDPGLCKAPVFYAPTDNCGNFTVSMLMGLPSGSFFPIGDNLVTFKVEDAAGNVVTCTLHVNILEFPDPTSTLKCNELIVASLDDAQPPSQPGNQCTGQAFINADMLLEGGPYGCYDHYQIAIMNASGQNVASQTNPPSASLILDCGDLGKIYTFKVTDPETGNS